MIGKFFRKIIFKVLTAIKITSFQRKPINTLKYNPTWEQWCLSFIGNQKDITISHMTMKTTTKTDKNLNSEEKWEKKVSKPFKP